MGLLQTKASPPTTSTNRLSGRRSAGLPTDQLLSVTSSNTHSPPEIKRTRSSTLPITTLFSSRREDDDNFANMYTHSARPKPSFSPNSPHKNSSSKLQIGSSVGGGLGIESPVDSEAYSPIINNDPNSPVVTKFTHTVTLSTDEEGNKLVNGYTIISTLGKGSYGKVKLVLDNDNKPFALKIMNKTLLKRVKKSGGGNLLMDVQREIAIMKKLSHPNVVRLYEVMDDRNSELLYLVIEYAENGALLSLTETNSENVDTKPCKFRLNQLRKYMIQAIEGIQYLHSKGICHRDIKPDNILLDGNYNVKISDFGVSHICEGNDDTVKGSAGTPAFLSPEACKGETYSGFKNDIWALGITLYSLLYNTTPFKGDSYMQMYNSIQNDDLEIPPPFDKDELLKDLLHKVLDKNPDTRISLEDFKNHSWIKAQYEMDSILQVTPQTPVAEQESTPSTPTAPSEQHAEPTQQDRLLLIVKMKQRMKKAALQAKLSLEEQERNFNKIQEEGEDSNFKGLISQTEQTKISKQPSKTKIPVEESISHTQI
ncbi:hypothetical protein C9374_006419 [Naegleria lovaniensis]|uniref:Protein kinase domain-containing protein n=1 Tax=Naegleria lovaniensis TaxID=51637 RepID=A0AA88GJS1_NAELO|nr:uncharacterized protein C9374_006419 [Naegleria lovaniensis]KAG2381430.1 hypothetical protein C9374_006419 [Naegleria lovaniensis]